jgi:hypothetical protein
MACSSCSSWSLAYLIPLPNYITTRHLHNVDQTTRQKAHSRQSACRESASSKEACPSGCETHLSTQTRRSRTSKSSSSKSTTNKSTCSKSSRREGSSSQSTRPTSRSQTRTSQSRQLDQPHSAGRRGERGQLRWCARWWSWEQCEWHWHGDWKQVRTITYLGGNEPDEKLTYKCTASPTWHATGDKASRATATT